MYRSTVVFLSRAAVLALALVGSACDNGPGTPTIPTPVLVTETFTGTVTLNGAINHAFSVSGPGPTTAEITAIDPAGSFLGFQMGTWSGAVCTAVFSNEAGTLASVLNGTTQSAASLCVQMHDPNGILVDKTVTYTVTVKHPYRVGSRVAVDNRSSAVDVGPPYSSITSSSVGSGGEGRRHGSTSG